MRPRRLSAVPAKFKYPKTVPHGGRVFAFAAKLADSGEYRIGYTALSSQSSNPDDDAIWTDFVVLSFPRELRPVGRGLIVIDFEDTEIPAADVPFEVVSDDSYIYVFRQSTNQTLYADRFVFDEVAGRLINVWETRYRRSRKFDLPLDRKDTFGSTDMEGVRFVEPTTELTFIGDVVDGRFAVAILPTELPRVTRWQIFAERASTGALDGFSILRSSNGLFDLGDSLDPETKQVPPDASYQLKSSDGTALTLASGAACSVYNRQELLADEYGRPQLQKRAMRLMLAVAAGTDPRIAVIDFGVGKDGKVARVTPEIRLAAAPPVGTGLLFVPQRASQVAIPAITGAPTDAMTFEAWLNLRAVASGTAWIAQSAADAALPFGLALVDGVPTFTVGADGATVQAVDALEAGYWVHLAAVWDGEAATINVNGQPWSEEADPPDDPAPPAAGYLLGGAAGLEGTLDEVRLWRVARTEAEILATMGTSLSPATAGWTDLVGYWKCDEPVDDTRFTVVANAANTGAAGNGALDGAMWARTSAPTASSMSPISWDANGLTVCAALLGFASTDATPVLIDGGDSRLHLYWSNRGDHQMMAAQLSTVMARASYTAPWLAADPRKPANDQRGEVCFIARYPGTWMNQTTVAPPAVTITVDPGKPNLATVVLRSTAGLIETWPKVPRDIAQLTEILNGTAIQTTDDPDAEDEDVVMYDYTRVGVQATGAQRGPQPAPGAGSNIFNCMPVEDPDNGMIALIEPTDAAPDAVKRYRVGIDAWWQYAPPPSTIDLSEFGQLVRVFSAAQIDAYDGALVVPGDATLETWVKPLAFPDNQSQVLLAFNKPPADGSTDPAVGTRYLLMLDPTGRVVCSKGEVAAITAGAVQPGVWTHVAGSYRTDFGIQLGGSRYLDAGNAQSLISTEAVTVEAWVRLDRLGVAQTIASKWSSQLGRSWALEVRADGKVAFTVNQDTGTSEVPRTATSAGALGVGTWHHVAGVYTVELVKETAIAFNNGSYVKLPQLTAPPTDAVSVMMWIKLVGPARLGKQVLIQSVDPQQTVPFLLYLWNGVPTFTAVVNGVSRSVRLPVPLRENDWIHIAGTYSADLGMALYIDGQSLGQPVTDVLDVKVPRRRSRKRSARADAAGVVAAYSVGGFAASDSFTGLINQVSIWNRGLTANEVRQRIARPPSASDRGLAGYWPFQDLFGTTAMDLAGTSNGEIVNGNWIRIDKGQFAHKVFIDGVVQAFEHVTDPVVGTAAPPVLLGSGYFTSFLQGAIGEVRLWKTGRMNWQIEYFAARNLESNAEGLLGDWTFEAGKGRVVTDQKGDNNAVIRDATLELGNAAIDAMWIHTTFKAGWTIFLDGVEVTSARHTLDKVGYGDAGSTIASIIFQQSIARIFTGELNDLRVWRTQRTAQQVRENMHIQLEGGEYGLVAYWTVSDGSSTTLADFTGFGANATWYGDGLPAWRATTAPIGIELPQIRCALGGLVTPWLATSLFAPGAAQYGAFEVDAKGTALAVYQRAYQFISDPDQDLALFGTFKVGDLDVQYVGQAQMAPTLTGYIEGPPPLPSENLKVYPGDPNGYNAASMVSVDETQTRLLSYSASRDQLRDRDLGGARSLHAAVRVHRQPRHPGHVRSPARLAGGRDGEQRDPGDGAAERRGPWRLATQPLRDRQRRRRHVLPQQHGLRPGALGHGRRLRAPHQGNGRAGVVPAASQPGYPRGRQHHHVQAPADVREERHARRLDRIPTREGGVPEPDTG
jgi:hypothetical protein